MFEKILECESPKEVMEMFDYNMEWLAIWALAMANVNEHLIGELNEMTSRVVEKEHHFPTDAVAIFISQQFVD